MFIHLPDVCLKFIKRILFWIELKRQPLLQGRLHHRQSGSYWHCLNRRKPGLINPGSHHCHSASMFLSQALSFGEHPVPQVILHKLWCFDARYHDLFIHIGQVSLMWFLHAFLHSHRIFSTRFITISGANIAAYNIILWTNKG